MPLVCDSRGDALDIALPLLAVRAIVISYLPVRSASYNQVGLKRSAVSDDQQLIEKQRSGGQPEKHRSAGRTQRRGSYVTYEAAARRPPGWPDVPQSRSRSQPPSI